MKKLFYTIGEVSEMLEVPDSTVRYWSDSFPRYVKPRRNAKGNRQFREEDIEALRTIKYLLKEKGLTIEGAEKQLMVDHSSVNKVARAIEILESLKLRLFEVRKTL